MTVVVAFLDTVEVFFRYLPHGLRKSIESRIGKRVRIEPCVSANGICWGFRVIVHQPSVSVLRELDRLQRVHGGKVRRFDVAYDGAQSIKWFEVHVIMRYRRAGPMHDEDHGFYLVQQQGRARQSARDIAIYGDRTGKLTGEIDVPHLEIRIQGVDAVRRQGVVWVKDLINIDPRSFFDKHIKLVDFDPEEFKQRIIRKAILEDVRRHRGRTVSDFVDQYRASLALRVRTILEHSLQDRVQRVKDYYPKYIAGLKVIRSDALKLPRALSWASLINNNNF